MTWFPKNCTEVSYSHLSHFNRLFSNGPLSFNERLCGPRDEPYDHVIPTNWIHGQKTVSGLNERAGNTEKRSSFHTFACNIPWVCCFKEARLGYQPKNLGILLRPELNFLLRDSPPDSPVACSSGAYVRMNRHMSDGRTYVHVRVSFEGRQVPFLSACQSWFPLSPLGGAACPCSFGGSLMPCGYFQTWLKHICSLATTVDDNAKVLPALRFFKSTEE